MNSVKQALEKDMALFDLENEKHDLNRLLFQKVIEKKRRQDEKFKLLFQGSLLLLMLFFLYFVISFTQELAENLTVLTGLVFGTILLFAHVCQRVLALLGRGNHSQG